METAEEKLIQVTKQRDEYFNELMALKEQNKKDQKTIQDQYVEIVRQKAKVEKAEDDLAMVLEKIMEKI